LTHTIHFGFYEGISGLLIALINLYNKGFREKRIIEIIRLGINYILSFRRDVDFDSGNHAMFPNKINGTDVEIEFSNELSWACSDLNQAILLYKSYPLLKDYNFLEIADLIGLNTLVRRDEKSTKVTNPYFIHGAAGVAQSYYYLYKLSNNQAYQTGYAFWIEKTTSLLKQEINRQ
jgi:lantibiotic modifying enzyme